jgi:hypothetical protein
MFKALTGSLAVFSLITFLSCQEKKTTSLTERYLLLQDSMLHAWNLMMNDDNQKLKSMQHLIHEMAIGRQADTHELASLQERLEQLWRIRFTQRTMANPDVIEEYDFAANSLVVELVALANSAPNFEQNTTLQSLTENITMADQRVLLHRADYDEIVKQYNTFLWNNKELIKAIDKNSSLEKKPLFGMSEE